MRVYISKVYISKEVGLQTYRGWGYIGLHRTIGKDNKPGMELELQGCVSMVSGTLDPSGVCES